MLSILRREFIEPCGFWLADCLCLACCLVWVVISHVSVGHGYRVLFMIFWILSIFLLDPIVYVYFGALLVGEFQEVVFMGYSSWGTFDGCFYEIQV
jgi:hypothetical protein